METSELISAAFWQSKQCGIMVNARDAIAVKEARMVDAWARQQPELSGHLLFSTSGSSGGRKWVALSRQALLASASMVNQYLSADANDRWLMALPDFHVGGMGILARCYDTGSELLRLAGKWDPELYRSTADSEGISLSSLVPAQLYDLVDQELHAPQSLRAVMVGGGRLSDRVYEQALELGWPVMETYGMTETCSQIATASPGSRDLVILPGWQTKISDRHCLSIKGAALLTGYVSCSGDMCELVDPKQEGWFTTGDVVQCEAGNIQVKGRVDRCVKVLGELVNLSEVESKVEVAALGHLPAGSLAVVALPDKRKGYKLILCGEQSCDLNGICKTYNLESHPVERLDGVCVLSEIPRSPLGKVRYGLISQLAAEQTK
ncbi:MAG: AMP-binding protein [Akkermansiaceae bacterium]|nr:AMP-binding protein [Akkermansiaceae bacterium]